MTIINIMVLFLSHLHVFSKLPEHGVFTQKRAAVFTITIFGTVDKVSRNNKTSKRV